MKTKSLVCHRLGDQKRDCHVHVGQVMQGPDGHMIVTRVDDPIFTDQGQKPWSQEFELRPCTPEETEKAKRDLRIAQLKHEQKMLLGPLDDERARPQREARKTAIAAELTALVDDIVE